MSLLLRACNVQVANVHMYFFAFRSLCSILPFNHMIYAYSYLVYRSCLQTAGLVESNIS